MRYVTEIVECSATAGCHVTVVLADADGSENLTSVSLSDFPVCPVPTWTIVGSAVVTELGGVYTITSSTSNATD